ncbi:glutathione S-transferase [Ramicandelaber brevisporus]|nr:glutathione S-transferase [Ramicandelaber brevisporus]
MTTSFNYTVNKNSGSRFAPEAGRYILYVTGGCPFAHRALLARVIKGLDGVIDTAYVDHAWTPNGWKFPADASEERFGSTVDPIYGAKYIRELYFKAEPNYSGRFTVPLFWDKKLHTAVNNESAQIVRFLNTEFNPLLPAEKRDVDLYPEHLRAEIDQTSTWLSENIIRSIYGSAFGESEEVKNAAAEKLYAGLDKLEAILSQSKYIVGDKLTEADINILPWIARLDTVYLPLVKGHERSLVKDYPATSRWVRRIYQLPGVAGTFNLDQIKLIYADSPVYNKHFPQGFSFPDGPDFANPHVEA